MTLQFGTDGLRGRESRSHTRARDRPRPRRRPSAGRRPVVRRRARHALLRAAARSRTRRRPVQRGRGRGARRRAPDARGGVPGAVVRHARGGDLGQPQPVPRQRREVVRPRRAQDHRPAGAAHRVELRRLVDAGAGDGPDGPRAGVARDRLGAAADYIAHLVAAPVVAASTGSRSSSTAATAPPSRSRRALRVQGARQGVLHDQPDGTNINAGCGSTDPSQLQQAVLAASAQRRSCLRRRRRPRIAVDERGNLVDGDQMLAIIALDMHERGAFRGRRRGRDGDVEPRFTTRWSSEASRSSRRRSAIATCSPSSRSAACRWAASSPGT